MAFLTDSFFPKYEKDPDDVARSRALWQETRARRELRDKALGEDYPTISEFYRGRDVFVTGASGFVGKVILEKLLRTCPEIGNVYVLLRTRRGADVNDRVKAILDLPIFNRLRRENPAALNKIVPMQGDCSLEGLGLSPADRRTLIDTVSVVIHSAASVRFTDPIKKAVLLNTRSSRDVVRLAKEMKDLKVLVHVSTSYCFTNHQPTMERVYPTEHHWEDVLKYAELPDAEHLDKLGPKILGFQPNSYVFSKALSENVMEEAAQQLPIVILRPSIVTGAINEPLPGWMDNLNGFAMFWAIFLKGVLRVHYSPRGWSTKFDLVPVDTVSDATIAASWAKATGQTLTPESGVRGYADVVNMTIGDFKPSSYSMMNAVLRHVNGNRKVVYPGCVRSPVFVVLSNKTAASVLKFFYEFLFGAIVDTALKACNRKPELMPIYRKVQFAFENLRYFTNKEFQFDTTNLWQLQAVLHPKDRDAFEMKESDCFKGDLKVGEIQILGVLKYALKEHLKTPEAIAKAWRAQDMLWWAEAIWYGVLGFALYCLVAWKISTLNGES